MAACFRISECNASTVNCSTAVAVDLRTCCCCNHCFLTSLTSVNWYSQFKIHSIIISRMIVSNEDIGLSLSGDEVSYE